MYRPSIEARWELLREVARNVTTEREGKAR